MIPIRSLAALAFLLQILPCSAAAGMPERDPMPSMERFGGKVQTEAGALLMVSGIGQDWAAMVEDVRKALGRRFFLETAPASDSKALQSAVERLQARKVKKIVVLPMLLSSHSAEMDENRYLFGIREHPSADFLSSAHGHSGYSVIRRIKSKVPVVLANALDDHTVLADILADRALAHSKDPSTEALVMVVPSLEGDLANSQWAGTIESLVDKVRRTARFKSAQAAYLPVDAAQEARDKAENTLRSTVRGLGDSGRVIVVPLSLAGGLDRRLRKVFDGLFVKIADKGVLPDKKISRWVEESLAKDVKLPDMRAYKKDEAPPARPRKDKLNRPLLSPSPEEDDVKDSRKND